MNYLSSIPFPESAVPDPGEPYYSLSGRATMDRLDGLPVLEPGQPNPRERERVRGELLAKQMVTYAAKQLGFYHNNPLRDRLKGRTPFAPGEWDRLLVILAAGKGVESTVGVACVGCGETFQTAESKASKARWCSPGCRRAHYKRPDRR